MEGKKIHHHWKFWLLLVFIVGIFGMLFYTNTLNFIKIGKFIETVNPPVQYFPIQLETSEDTFFSHSFSMTNTSINAKGICQTSVSVNDISVTRDGIMCDVILDGFNGNIDFSAGGNMIISGNADGMRIGDSSFSSGKSLNVYVEMIPTEFLLTDISMKSLSLPDANGKISKIKGGEAAVIGILNNSPLEIDNFNGYLKLENGKMILTGETTSVKSQEFKW